MPRVEAVPASWLLRDTTWDRDIFNEVVINNVYGLPERLESNHVVIDVGAHIGSFSYAAYIAGSRNIFAYEPEQKNFELLVDNVGRYGITCVNRPVFRSDKEMRLRYRQHPNEKNTGGGDVFGVQDGDYLEAPVGLDKVIEEATKYGKRIRLLKLDCEGSEYPIIFSSNYLHMVDEIVGEYHPTVGWQTSFFDDLPSPNIDNLKIQLEQRGFDVAIRPTKDGLGFFRGVFRRKTTPRKKNCKVGVVIPVWLQNQATMNMTRDCVSRIRSANHQVKVYIVTTRLHVCSAEDLDADLAGRCAHSLTVIHDPGVAKSVGKAWNDGIKRVFDSGCDYGLILASDVHLEPSCIDELVNVGEEGVYDMWSGRHTEPGAPVSNETHDGCDFSCAMLRRDTVVKHGYFDENYLQAYFEDNDYYARINIAGGSCSYIYAARFFHFGSQTIKLDEEAAHHCNYWFNKNLQRYRDKWGFTGKFPEEMPGTKEAVLAQLWKTPYNIPGKSLRDCT